MFHCNYWSYRHAYAHASSGNRRPFYESRASRHSRTSQTGGGGFGVRRPLRYLSYHLELDESQRRGVAASFERIKLEREQAELDHKKLDASLADQFARADVSVDDLRQALAPRAQTDANMQTVIAKELYEIAAILNADQREEFAHLLRTGVLKL
jgi:hypothetical protein